MLILTGAASTRAQTTAPFISTQPKSQSVAVGQPAKFAVGASGAIPMNFQWKKNGVAISGATSTGYKIPAVTMADNGARYTVIVHNGMGTTTSSTAVLTVNASSSATAPSITTQPGSRTVTVGQTASFSVAAAGSGPLSYQWQKNGAAIAGATSASYTTPVTTSSDNGAKFAVVVKNSVGSATSNAATLTVSASTSTYLLNASPTSLSFGNVNTSSSNLQAITLKNSGNSNVSISNVSVSGAGFNVSGVSTGTTLTPGQSVTLNVAFAPSATGSVTGRVSVSSNATNSPGTVNLSGTGVVQHAVALSWNDSASTLAGFNIYRSATSGSGYVKINSSLISGMTYIDSNVSSGTTYFYVTTAVDSTGNESAYSNQASAAIP